MDLSVWCVEKNWKKEVHQNSKYKKNDKWNMNTMQNSDSGKTVMRQWSWKKILQLLGSLFLVKFQRLFWAKILKFLWLKFQAQFWSILSSINLGSCEKFTQIFFVLLFWFYSSILVPFTRIPLCLLPFLVCLNFLLVNFIEYSFKSCQISTPFAVVLQF